MLLLERKGETIDDRTENFEEFSNAIEPLGFINELEEDVVDRSTDERSEVQEFAVYAMQSCFQEIPLPWVF